MSIPKNVEFKQSTLARNLILTLLFMLACFYTGEAFAHPEDDFCGPDSGIDPVLCEQLAQLNSSEGAFEAPLLDSEGNVLKPIEAALYFLDIGVKHILPGGLDHILFVFALFLAATNLRNLIFLISIFTVAHTITLGLTAAGVIQPPAHIVEPLIALSIAFVAIENLFLKDKSRWRPLIILGFGLFHGMGFAGFISEIGLPQEQFWPSLIGFNVGVEIGQLTVVALAFLVSIPVRWALDKTNFTYQQVVVVPLSLVIAGVGMWWFVTRSLGI
ncbi:HupE/UreJ family protein [Hirschia maritima]|uniref:HupE/UreJ family protein n=1 Tax=Hirschia maritima TaxID=1121961 RepID=UPI00035DFDBA|nr:HupE/UreJ family protein [Hirschia maritima]